MIRRDFLARLGATCLPLLGATAARGQDSGAPPAAAEGQPGAPLAPPGPAPAGRGMLSHAVAMLGVPHYGPDFDHFDYADPAAPRGGELIQSMIGTFDNLNPFIVFGTLAVGVRNYHFASLTARSWDEPFTLYPFVAASFEMPTDRRWITFRLDPRASFHDGSPITIDDVLFTVETLHRDGLPGFRRNYDRIAAVERVPAADDLAEGVRFTFTGEADRETPLIIALMPILSRAWYSAHPFDRTTLEPPLGSGPYRIAEIDPGRRITFERVRDWWAADLPAFRGHNNFDRLRFDYYRDPVVALEAFKVGQVNFRREPSGERWATSYDFPAVADGRVTRLALPHQRPSGMRGFVFNTRRPIFADPAVREALLLAFDFEWINRTLLHGQYRRITSMFTGSPLAATGVPEGDERDLLEHFRGRVPEALFDHPAALPETDGSGDNRANLRRAVALLDQAGWHIRDGRMTRADGLILAFEIVLADTADERVSLAFADPLRRLGIEATVRTVDTAQYTARTDRFDFDMIINHWNVTLSPGAEQDLYWGSRSAGIEGTRNYAGVRDPVVDALIAEVADAHTPEAMTAAARALDRVLLWGRYTVPLYYLDRDLFAWWGGLRRVEGEPPLYGTVVEAWWSAP